MATVVIILKKNKDMETQNLKYIRGSPSIPINTKNKQCTTLMSRRPTPERLESMSSRRRQVQTPCFITGTPRAALPLRTCCSRATAARCWSSGLHSLVGKLFARLLSSGSQHKTQQLPWAEKVPSVTLQLNCAHKKKEPQKYLHAF